MSSGAALRDRGHAQLELTYGSAGDTWAERARWYIESLESGSLLDADSLRAAVGDALHPNAVGAVMRRAALDGLIQVAGFKQSERTERRASSVKVWVRA